MELDYIELFKMYLYEQERSQNTIDCYSRDIRQLRGYTSNYGDVGLQDLAQINLTHFSKVLKSSGQSYKTINRKITSINSFYKFMYDKGYVEHLLSVKPLKIRIGNEFKGLSNQELWKIRTVIHKSNNKMHICLFELLYNTGIRISELVNLNLDSIAISARKGNIIVLGKGEVVREIPLNKEARKAVADYLEIRHKVEGNLLIGQRGNLKQSGVNRILKKYGNQMGIEISAHKLRHTFGFQLAQKNTSPYVIQNLLGHANVSTSSIYCQSTSSEKIKAIELID